MHIELLAVPSSSNLHVTDIPPAGLRLVPEPGKDTVEYKREEKNWYYYKILHLVVQLNNNDKVNVMAVRWKSYEKENSFNWTKKIEIIMRVVAHILMRKKELLNLNLLRMMLNRLKNPED